MDGRDAGAHFNGLTPAEAERLALLAEEAAELVQAVGKALRHGLDSRDPTDEDAETNRALIERELGDLNFAGLLMLRAGDISPSGITAAQAEAAKNKPRWLHHQGARS